MTARQMENFFKILRNIQMFQKYLKNQSCFYRAQKQNSFVITKNHRQMLDHYRSKCFQVIAKTILSTSLSY